MPGEYGDILIFEYRRQLIIAVLFKGLITDNNIINNHRSISYGGGDVGSKAQSLPW